MTNKTDETLEDMGREAKGAILPEETSQPGEGWGLFPDMNIEAYHLDPAPQPSISNSTIPRLLNETPLDFAYHHPRLNPDFAVEEAKETVESRRGDIVHQLALGKGRGYAVGDFKDWRTSEAKAFKERAIVDKLTPCLRSQFEEAEIMAEVIKERIKVKLDGADYLTEVGVLYQEETKAGPIWVRCLLDVYCPEKGIILDPKITPQLYDGTVGRHMVNMGWDRQAVLYPRAVGMCLPKLAGRIEFADLMVKPEPPYTSRFIRPPRAWDHSSIRELRRAFERFGTCLYSGRWPGFGDEITTAAMPIWEEKRREEADLREGSE